jgi:hypothetical protein
MCSDNLPDKCPSISATILIRREIVEEGVERRSNSLRGLRHEW